MVTTLEDLRDLIRCIHAAELYLGGAIPNHYFNACVNIIDHLSLTQASIMYNQIVEDIIHLHERGWYGEDIESDGDNDDEEEEGTFLSSTMHLGIPFMLERIIRNMQMDFWSTVKTIVDDQFSDELTKKHKILALVRDLPNTSLDMIDDVRPIIDPPHLVEYAHNAIAQQIALELWAQHS